MHAHTLKLDEHFYKKLNCTNLHNCYKLQRNLKNKIRFQNKL